MYDTDPDWAPTLHLGHNERRQEDNGRHKRRKNRQAKKDMQRALEGAKRVPLDVPAGDATDAEARFRQEHQQEAAGISVEGC